MALAEVFEKKVPGCELIFVGTPRGLEADLIPKTRWRLELMTMPSWMNKKGFSKVTTVFQLAGVGWQVWRLLTRTKPDWVLSLGGYVGGPVAVLAAWRKIRTAIVEPNAMPGISNLWSGKWAHRVYVAFEESKKYFKPQKVRVTGVPVRPKILKEALEVSRETEPFVVFVFGGSQGASAINAAMIAALESLVPVKEKIHIIHQIGRKADSAAITRRYKELGFSHEVYPFIDNMGLHYGRAHLVVARSGASTMAELMAIGRASILIPRGGKPPKGQCLRPGGFWGGGPD